MRLDSRWRRHPKVYFYSLIQSLISFNISNLFSIELCYEIDIVHLNSLSPRFLKNITMTAFMNQIEETVLMFKDFDRNLEVIVPSSIQALKKGHFLEIINDSECEAIFTGISLSSLDEPLDEVLEKGAKEFLNTQGSDSQAALHLLSVGVAALCLWTQQVQCGPTLSEGSVQWLIAHRGPKTEDEAMSILERPARGEVCGVVEYPTLLLLARVTLRTCARWTQLKSASWWWMRALFMHQQALGEPIQAFHEQLTELLEAGPPSLATHTTLSLLWLETVKVHLWYGHLIPARKALESARQTVGISLNLTGVMGKRTRFQEKETAQLILKVNIEDHSQQVLWNNSESLPKDVQLNDEVRLERINATEEADCLPPPLLSPAQQAVVLGTFSLTQHSQPQDGLAQEELLPYLQVVLANPCMWSIQITALVLRSRLESRVRRTAERAMCQLEEVVGAIKRSTPDVKSRFQGLWSVSLPLFSDVQCDLANSLLRLGCVQSALDIFLELKKWEAAVACYNMLELHHKAAHLLRRELAVKETVPLLCLLGDATDDVLQYERAWELSEHHSARAQRHWGMYFFKRKEYAASIPHLQLSLQCNSLQPELWCRLGYAALDVENWELCASAYRRCVELDSENMEAWNNLAKAYVKTGQKARAWHALQEALKVDFENWQLWDNVAIVSADVGAFDEVVRAYHRLLDLQSGRHVDIPILHALVSAITNNVEDCEGHKAEGIRPQVLALFGRITSQVTTNAEVWQLYAELTASLPEQTSQTLERTAQYLQRAHRAATQQNGWATQRESCKKTLAVSSRLADAYLICSRARPDPQKLLTTARFTLTSVLTAVKKEVELAIEMSTELNELEGKLTQIDEILRTLQST